MEPDLGKTYCFGDYVLEPSEHRLTRTGEEIALRPKTFEVLAFLVQHHDHRVTKEELFSAIWPETFVTEKVLRHSIWEIRGVLNNRGEDPEFIKTFPKVGYQFVGDVKEGPAEKLVTRAGLRTLAVGALCCAQLVLAVWYFGPLTLQDQISSHEIDSIAVLPFTSITDDEESQSLAFGLATHISSSLSGLERLRIKPAAVLMRYQGKEIDPRTVADEQNVDAVLLGSVEKRGENLSITVSLINGRDNTQIWAEPFRGVSSGIFALQEEVFQRISNSLRPSESEEQEMHIVRRGTNNQEAYEAYLVGDYRLSRWIYGEIEIALDNAIESFEKAIEFDPNFQAGHRELARTYFGRARNISQSDEEYDKARKHLKRVIEVDDSTALAHQARARLLWQYDGKWGEAEQEYRRAAELDATLETDSSFLEWMCRLEEVKVQTERLEDRSDPLSPYQLVIQANLWLWIRRYDRAIERAIKALALEPELLAAHFVLNQAYQKVGKNEEAFELFLESERSRGTPEEEVTAIKKSFQDSGMPGVRKWLFDHRWRSEYRKPVSFAATYVQLGDKDKAFKWLEKLWEQPLFGMDSSPACLYWDPLRDDPRFEELLRKLNLPEEAIRRHLALPSS